MIETVKKGNINICRLVLGSVRTNTYIVYGNTGECFVVDPADESDIIKIKLTDLNLTVKAILLTHGHFDHIGGADALRKAYGAVIYAFNDEKQILESCENNLSSVFGRGFTLKADKWLSDNEKINIAGMDIQVIHTPGHTIGSVCYLVSSQGEKILISGDTLFCGSCGRYDFPTGSYGMIIKSIKERLLVLDEKLAVYPGHNEETTIGQEKIYY